MKITAVQHLNGRVLQLEFDNGFTPDMLEVIASDVRSPE